MIKIIAIIRTRIKMGKINITEGELKQIIRESVENIINEAYADRNDKYLTARNNYNNYAKEWGSLTPEQQAVYNQQAGGGWTGEALYNDARDKAARKLRRTTRRNGQQFKQELDNTKNEYAKSRDEVDKLSYNNQLLQNQVNTLTSDKQQLSTELAQLHNAIGSKGNMQTALKTIKQWKANSVELTNLQKTSQQQNAAANQQQAPANPQRMMAETKEEGIGDTVKTTAQKVKNTARNTLGKVKKTVNNTKQAVGNAAKSWVDKRDAHDKVMSSNPNSTLASNYINRF